MNLSACAAAGLTALCASSMMSARAAEVLAYPITKTIALGSPDHWDFLSFDASSHRVYVTHNTEIVAVDGRSGAIIGRVANLSGVNGVAVVPEIGKGYAGSRGKRAGIVFDLTTLKVIKEIPAKSDTDAVIYDPVSKRVFIMHGDPHSTTVIDTATDAVVGTVALGGVPEHAVVDGAGSLYVNLADRREILRIDTHSLKVSATWPIAACESPHGLSMDTTLHRLFSSCVNRRLMVIDSNDGRVIATLPIGEGTDACVFDPKRRRVLSSNGDGTLSIIHEEGPEKYLSLGEVATQRLARTMAIDPDSGRVYLVTGDPAAADHGAISTTPSSGIRPGSVHVLFLDPN